MWGMARLLRIAPVSREMILNFVAQHSLRPAQVVLSAATSHRGIGPPITRAACVEALPD